jgi:diphthamide biosynthesis methyltransferase
MMLLSWATYTSINSQHRHLYSREKQTEKIKDRQDRDKVEKEQEKMIDRAKEKRDI